MVNCCILDCKSDCSPISGVIFYKIPSGQRHFQRERRHLWKQAIQQANGSMVLDRNSRICNAHFISGKASMDRNKPDYVPSVFTHTKRCTSPSRRKKQFSSRRKRHRPTANAATEEQKPPPRADSPTGPQFSDLIEAESKVSVHSPSTTSLSKALKKPNLLSPCVILKRKMPSWEVEIKDKRDPVQSPAKSIPDVASPSPTAPAGIPELDKRRPVVLLKPLLLPAGGYLCELCGRTFAHASQLLTHKKLHDEQTDSVSGGGDLAHEQTDSDPAHEKKDSVSGGANPAHEQMDSDPAHEQTDSVSGGADLAHEQTDSVSGGADPAHEQMDSDPAHEQMDSVSGGADEQTESVSVGADPAHEQMESVSGGADPAAAPPAPGGQPEPSFPCNLCDRVFASAQNLKRHKLLHVRDGRKCPKCGVLFCRRHGRVAVQPKAECKTESDEDYSPAEGPERGAPCPGKRAPDCLAPSIQPVKVESAPSPPVLRPAPLILIPVFFPKPPPPPSQSIVSPSESAKASAVPRPTTPILLLTAEPEDSSPPVSPAKPPPPPPPSLPPSLKMFSPEYLTSAFLEVQRNYKYILRKSQKGARKKPDDSAEPSSRRQAVKPPKKEKIAYDLEVVL